MEQRGVSGGRTTESLARSTRGSAGKEYLIATLLVGLVGLGGMKHYGAAAGSAIAGDAQTGVAAEMPSAGGMAVTSMAGKASSDDADLNDPYGVQRMGTEELNRRYAELRPLMEKLNALSKEQLEGYLSQMSEKDREVFAQGRVMYPELENEFNHRNFDAQANAAGAKTDEDRINFVYEQYEKHSAQLVAWEEKNGPCLDDSTEQVLSSCPANIGFLANVTLAEKNDLDRRLVTMTNMRDRDQRVASSTEDKDGKKRGGGTWQGTWSTKGFVVGPKGLLKDKKGRLYLYEIGVKPADAVSGKAKPLGVYDVHTGDVTKIKAPKEKAKKEGLWHTLWSIGRGFWNVGDGAIRQVNDVVLGGAAVIKNVGWNFLWDDTIRGAYRTFTGKHGGWTFTDNPIASIINAVIKTPPSLGHTAGDMLHQFSLCANLRNGQDAHGRGQACGRTIVNAVALYKGGSIAKNAIVGWRSTAAVAEGAAATGTIRGFASSFLRTPRDLVLIPAYKPETGKRFSREIFDAVRVKDTKR